MVREELLFSPAESEKRTSATLRDLLSSLLHKRVSDRLTVREAQEHPWMERMAPRRGDGQAGGGAGGGGSASRPSQPPPFKQVCLVRMYVAVAVALLRSG